MWVFRIVCIVSVFYPVHVIQLNIMAAYKLIRGHSAGFICGIRTVSVCVCIYTYIKYRLVFEGYIAVMYAFKFLT